MKNLDKKKRAEPSFFYQDFILLFTFIERKFYDCCRDEFFSYFDEDFVTEFAV